MISSRLDRVEVLLGGGDLVVLPWPSRQALLERLGHDERTAKVRYAFEAVGASRPVELKLEQKRLLLDELEAWRGDSLPTGVDELGAALEAERDAGTLAPP